MAEKRPLSDRMKRLAEVSATFTDEELNKRFGGTITYPGKGASNEITEYRSKIRAQRANAKRSTVRKSQVKQAGLTGDEGY